MPKASLEEIRLLSNLETDEHKLLQIVLFGQPELEQTLADPSIRQLRERITHRLTLPPLPAAAIEQYLDFRLRACGYTGPNVFTPRLSRLIARYSQGLSRRINILADKALLAAYSQGRHQIHRDDIHQAAQDSQFAHAWAPRSWGAMLTAAAITALCLGLIGSAWWPIEGLLP